MKKFSAAFLSSIRNTLESGDYQAEDFDFEQATKSDVEILKIRYRAYPAFFFSVEIRVREKTETDSLLRLRTVEDIGDIQISARPGKILEVERSKCDEKSEVIDALESWAERMDRELTAIPLNRKVEEQRRQLEELTEQVGEIAEGYFSIEEAEQLKARLDASS